MRVVYMGTPDFAVPPLKKLVENGFEVPAVFTQPDKSRGRSKQLIPCEVKAAALELGLPVIQPAALKSDEVFEQLRDLTPDVIVVAAYGHIIPKRILELPQYGCINIHASLLPAYRGAAPIQWAVLNGESVSGVTIMQMAEGLDTGDILMQEQMTLDKDETSESLFDKLADLGAKLLPETLSLLEKGEIMPVAQPEESTTPYARMITKQDGLINWGRPAKELDCFVRGMNSWPCAFSKMNGRNVKFWKAEAVSGNTGMPAGSLVKTGKDGLFVQTGDGCLSVLELQAEGKKRMRFNEFLRGANWKTGMQFGEE